MEYLIEYAIVDVDFADEILFLERYLKLIDQSTILESFSYFIKSGFMSEEYYFPKGHLVLAKFEKNSNKIIVDNKTKTQETKKDSVKLKITFFETIFLNDKK